MNITDHIESNPKVMLGKPVIKGTRITVELILIKLSEGFTHDELLVAYPHLQLAGIQACIKYAAQVIQSEEVIQAA